MIQAKLTLINALGLHARASAKLVACCSRYLSQVTIMKASFPATAVPYGSSNFSDNMVDAIQKNGIFILNSLPTQVEEAIEQLYQYGDEIFNKLEAKEIQASDFPREQDSSRIKMVANKREGFGSCYWGHRVFGTLTQDKEQNSHAFPVLPNSAAPSPNNAAQCHFEFIQSIYQLILAGLEKKLGLQENSLQKSNLDNAVLGLTRYLPATRERLRDAFNDKKLLLLDKANHHELMAFAKHTDYASLSALVYRNGKTDGLFGEYALNEQEKKWLEIQVPASDKPQLIIFSGRQLHFLTNGNTVAFPHYVSINAAQQQEECRLPPEKMRFLLAFFSMNNSESLSPALTTSGMPIEPPVGQTSPYMEYNSVGKPLSLSELSKDHFGKLVEEADRCAVTDPKLLAEILEAYPEGSLHDEILRSKAVNTQRGHRFGFAAATHSDQQGSELEDAAAVTSRI